MSQYYLKINNGRQGLNWTSSTIDDYSMQTAAFKEVIPLPTTSSISPNSKNVGDTTYTMTVTGTNFISGSIVRFNGSDQMTTYVSNTSLNATIPGTDLTIVGTYSITVFNPTPGGGTSGAQTFTVNKAIPIITWSNPSDITYGTALSGTQLNAVEASSIAGTFAYTPASGAVLGAGNSQNLHAVFTPTDTVNYTSASKDVTINVLKATPVITWSNPSDITYGTALSGTQLNAVEASPIAGTFAYTPGSGTILSAGAGQTLHVVFTPTDTANYNSASKDVTINVVSMDTYMVSGYVSDNLGTELTGVLSRTAAILIPP